MAGSRIKCITIEIGGDTTQLSKALKDVNSSIKGTQDQLKDVNKLLKLDPTNTELLRQKHDLLSKAVDDTKEKLELEKKALEQLKAGPQTEETIQQQKNLEREIISTNEYLKQYQKELKNSEPLLQKLGKGAEDVANKTKALSMAAGAFGVAMLGNAYNSAKAADELATLSRNTGFSVEELQKMQYASDLVDVSLDQMTGAATRLTKQMGSGSKVFEELGVAIYDADGNMRDSTEVFYESLQALSQIENETERDAKAMELFGKSANDLSGIIDDGGEALKDYGDEAEELGLILGEDDVDAANEFNDAIDKAKARVSAAFTKMGSALAKSLVPMLEKLLAIVTKVVTWFSNLNGGTQKLILVIVGLVAAISPLAAIITKVTTLASGLSAAFTFMTSPVGLVVTAIAALIAIGVALYQNWDTIKAKATALWSSITATFNNIKNSIANAINSAKDIVANAIERIKGMFNFSWSLPHIKLPHFRVYGGQFPYGLGGMGSFPQISVDWYKKAMENGIILDSPTIFGTMNGKLLGAGEAGSETIVGTKSLMSMIREASGNGMTVNMTVQGGNVSANELADIVIDKLTQKIQRGNQRW